MTDGRKTHVNARMMPVSDWRMPRAGSRLHGGHDYNSSDRGPKVDLVILSGIEGQGSLTRCGNGAKY